MQLFTDISILWIFKTFNSSYYGINFVRLIRHFVINKIQKIRLNTFNIIEYSSAKKLNPEFHSYDSIYNYNVVLSFYDLTSTKDI